MRARRPSALVNRVAAAAALACSVALASCAAPSNQATPPSTTPSPSPSSSVSTGPVVTAPGLSTSAASPSSTAEEPSTPAPEPPATSEPEPAPEPEITAEPAQSYDPGPEPAPAPAPAPAPPAPAPAGSGGITVVIDPGHNGANGANPGIINALVPAGFGQTKPCNTTGTSTDAGYDEHIFTWRVANDLEPILRASGINVIMTRPSDDGVGPCVNERAAIGNDANADVVISIHGDGDDASAQGYYVMTAEQDPAGPEMAARSHALAVKVRDGLTSVGLSPSNHLGDGGLWPRNDLAGLNLSVRPTVMIEAGNMRNDADADLMSSPAGQQQIAQGLANGVLAFLGVGGAG